MRRIIPLLLISLALAACSSTRKADKEPPSAEAMYKSAREEMDAGNFNKAAKDFESLAARYPYGRFAQQAELEIAYAHYKDGEAALALAAVDRFVRQHPSHPGVDYAYYLRGLIHTVKEDGLLAQLGQQDLAERDPKAARESFEAFRQLVTRFPDSRYAPDARDRMALLVSALAKHELHVARYYYRRGAFLAAANHAKSLIEAYPRSDRVESALLVMASAYDRLGQTDLRDDTRRVAKLNFPQSSLSADEVFADEDWWKLW